MQSNAPNIEQRKVLHMQDRMLDFANSPYAIHGSRMINKPALNVHMHEPAFALPGRRSRPQRSASTEDP
jgi:hypothetical protein